MEQKCATCLCRHETPLHEGGLTDLAYVEKLYGRFCGLLKAVIRTETAWPVPHKHAFPVVHADELACQDGANGQCSRFNWFIRASSAVSIVIDGRVPAVDDFLQVVHVANGDLQQHARGKHNQTFRIADL